MTTPNPNIPQNIVLTTGNGQNYLTWSQVLGATNYSVQSSPSGLFGTFTTIATTTLNSFLDTTGTPGVQVWYQVASINAAGTSPYNAVGTNRLPLTIVPCLPGQINLGYLRYHSRLRADKIRSNFLTVDEWNFNINQSATRLYDLLVKKYGEKYFFAPPLVFSTNGTDVYPLPDGSNYPVNGVPSPALYKLAGVDASSGAASSNVGNAWFTLPTFNWIDRNRFNTLNLAGTVTSVFGLAYCQQGANLYFQPIPTTANAIRLWYVPMLTQMLLDTDMMPFSISGWSELVIVDAAIKACIKEESYDQAQSLINERTGLLTRIEETAPSRDVGQPNVISNTRSGAGDPNFGALGSWGSGGFGPNGFGGLG
jgi:hypothetical protein